MIAKRLCLRPNENKSAFLIHFQRKIVRSKNVKETLIKSDVQIAPSNFSSDCAKTVQESWRISSSFCAVLAENLQVSCTSKHLL